MYQRLLVALGNEADIDQKVLAEAIAIASASEATLNLINVLSPPDSGYPNPLSLTADGMHSAINARAFQRYLSQWQAHQQTGQQTLNTQASEIRQTHGIVAEWTQAVGDPGRQICRVAKDWNADLIVIGRHNRSSLSELWIGSVSNYVMHHAGCSVIVVQGHPSTAPA